MSWQIGRAGQWLVAAAVWSLMSVIQAARSSDLVAVYELAQRNDPTFQSARHALEAARQKQPEALSGLLPVLSVNASDSRTGARARYSITPEINRTYNSDQWSLQLTQPLFRADRILAYDASRALVEQAIAQYRAAQQDLMLRTSRAYFDEIVAERHVAAAHAQVDALNEQLNAARHSFDAGVASITDVDDTRSRSALAQAQLVSARNDLESAIAGIESIIGEPPDTLLPLRDEVTLPTPQPADAASWVQRASEENPAVRAARAVVKGADYELDRSHSQRLPAVDLVASYGGNYSGGNVTDPVNFGTNVRDKQITVQLSMPLLDGGGMQAAVAEARAQRSKAQSDLTAAQRQAALDARQSFSAALSGASQVLALQAAVSAGQNAVKGNRIGYTMGIRINSDVLNAEQQLFSSMQDLDKARYDTMFAGLKLKAAAGILTEEDLSAVNALLRQQIPGSP